MTVVWHHEHHRHARYVAPDRFSIARLLLLAVLVIVFLFGGGWFFLYGWRSGVIPPAIESWLYVPVGIEEGHVLWYAQIARLARGIAVADEEINVTETDYAQAIEATVRRNALSDLAQHVHVSVTNNEVQSSIAWTDDIRAFQELSGWSDDEYAKFIIEGFILSTKTEEAVLGLEEYQDASHERMSEIQAKIDVGIAFEDLAKEYSEDPVTAQAKGSFGYVLPGEVDEAFAPVFNLPEYEISSIITTDDSYWLLRTEDTVFDESGTRKLLRGIAVRKTLLSDVLDSVTEDITPFLWVR